MSKSLDVNAASTPLNLLKILDAVFYFMEIFPKFFIIGIRYPGQTPNLPGLTQTTGGKGPHPDKLGIFNYFTVERNIPGNNYECLGNVICGIIQLAVLFSFAGRI